MRIYLLQLRSRYLGDLVIRSACEVALMSCPRPPLESSWSFFICRQLLKFSRCAVFNLCGCTRCLDDHADRPVEDSPAPEAGPRSQEAGPLLRVRRRRPHAAHVHLRPHRPLVGLYLVRYRKRGETLLGAQDRLAGQPGRVHREAIQLQRSELWPLHQGQVRHRAVLHLQQPDQRGLWKRVP